ncbi:hypothetical protein Cgig2_020057 [Carnegiea gigantea]|uniref:Alpha/beta hydrolase fold-3 domain-containing protein n=1 Tax=Carnegiea gigantea TaxID=171969 RepID=A0A9Q1QH27_9CARY|nr:hypothetical protein Cgig2_020057 [Carnegiea gigantea]
MHTCSWLEMDAEPTNGIPRPGCAPMHSEWCSQGNGNRPGASASASKLLYSPPGNMVIQGLMQNHEQILEYFKAKGMSAEILASYKPVINTTTLMRELKQVQKKMTKALGVLNSTRHIVLYYEDALNNRTSDSGQAQRDQCLDPICQWFELGSGMYMSRAEPEFAKRNARLVSLHGGSGRGHGNSLDSLAQLIGPTCLGSARVYKNGRVERYILTSKVPPDFDLVTEAQSKDVTISEEPNIRARIFLPKIDPNKPGRFPLLVHYHGGGFCTGSAFGPMTKHTLTRLVSCGNIIAISIEYRLPPEHFLPIAYEDSWAGLRWVSAHAKGNGLEPWLNEYVDYDKVFLGGESAGANIAHDVAIQAAVNPLESITLVGLVLIHPYFASEVPDKLIQYLYPTSTGTHDDPKLNPGVDPRLSKLACKKVLVCVAEKDKLRDRGVAYYKSLMNSGWEGSAELLETEGEEHCFHLFNPTLEKTRSFLYQLASFISDDVNE